MTTIGPATSLSGDLTSEDDVVVEGRFSGQIVVRDASVSILEDAEVDADIRAARVRIAGRVRGHIHAGVRIELTSTAVVSGTLSANQVVVMDGATFTGRIDMDRRTIAARVAHYRATRTA